MKNFKLLNNTISFDEDLLKCSKIYLKKSECLEKYSSHYDKEKQEKINNIEELINYSQVILNAINFGIDSAVSDVLNIFVENSILDKSETEIKQNCSVREKANQYLAEIQISINQTQNEMNNVIDIAERESARIADNSVQGNYINILSNSVWDLTVADYMNYKEEEKVERKKERIYQKNVRWGYQQASMIEQEICLKVKTRMETDLKTLGRIGIEELFLYCIKTLIEYKKLSSSVIDNIDKEKSMTILQNVKKVLDRKIVYEQLLTALKTYPFSKEIHCEILKHISTDTDIKSYIDLIEFIGCKDIATEICLENCFNKLDNTTYLKVLKNIDSNRYLQMCINQINNSSNEDISQEIENNQHKFKILKDVWEKDNPIISQNEKKNFNNIIHKIQTKYNVEYNGNIEDLNYENLKSFLENSKQVYTMNKLEKKKKVKKIICYTLFVIWCCGLLFGGGIEALLGFLICFCLPIVIIYKLIRKLISKFKK